MRDRGAMTNPRGTPMSDAPRRKYRRILLQIDSSTHSRHTMVAAIEIAARLGGELQGVFVEDSDLATVSDLGFVREYRFLSPGAHRLDRPTLEAQFRAMARSMQRQLEQAARQRQVAVGFRAVRGAWPASESDLDDADLVIIETTGRLQSRNLRDEIARRGGPSKLPRPTLLLKGAKSLSAEALIICDSVSVAEIGVRTARQLLSIPLSNITLLPLGLDEGARARLAEFATSLRESEGETARVLPPLSAENAHLLKEILAQEMLVIAAADGLYLRDPKNLQQLLTSRHPLLLLH